MITIDDYIANNGYSSKHFVNHFLYFIKHQPNWVELHLYRYKIRLVNKQDPNQELVVKVHWNGKSRRYVTILAKGGRKELVTFHNSLNPKTIYDVAISLLPTPADVVNRV